MLYMYIDTFIYNVAYKCVLVTPHTCVYPIIVIVVYMRL